ncbi:undecaprenyl-diphosphate phosphatase [Oryzihumus leptocrescens]|uniref:Undecaprenyl-diphosphatase n=1 Tax=Oryzihumus leptocrescens TaxID=297536 RepID=A0A542ZF91_9MICO|nr:undecaprenyl-diphosphate phosphatase [Oryzihumus leptocrescens]TQL58949.1 undecaprenyl-diphosphatase [Oryzihumus leptocrescens]
MLTYLQAAVIGLLQGVTELFPVSSLGHSVLVPAWLGGSWEHLVTESATQTSEQSPYLAFIVALHVATAVALLVFFLNDWVRIIRAFCRSLGPSLRARRLVAADPDERLAWLIVLATIPVGLIGLALEHTFRTLFAKPLAAAIFLTLNGLILLLGEWLRRLAPADEAEEGTAQPVVEAMAAGAHGAAVADPPVEAVRGRRTRRLATLHYGEGVVIGLFQSFALLAGISRSGVSMVGGLARGLSHRDAARFSFLLATPVILAAGVLKLPTLAGPAGHGILGQVVLGSVVAGVAAYASVRWLTRYFETRTLTPFAVYCLIAGIASIIRFA